jgi:hypothetical protein
MDTPLWLRLESPAVGKKRAAQSAHLALFSAALRHLRDAEHLADATTPHGSLDQAYHLAGFAPECGRKATIAADWMNKALGHDLGVVDEIMAALWADGRLPLDGLQ